MSSENKENKDSKDGNNIQPTSEVDEDGEKQVTDPEKIAKVIKLLENLNRQTGEGIPSAYLDKIKRNAGILDEPNHAFWKTQPVPQKELPVDATPGAIHEDIPIEKISSKSIGLPKEFEWVEIDLDDSEDLDQLYNLLKFNYNEDTDGMFRFDYSSDFLKWALKPPSYKKEWHIGVRVAATKKLVAFISGVPIEMKVLENEKAMVEINFLCVHKKLRSKRLAPVLIKEVTRRVHLTGVFQAVYTAGVKIPTPVAVCPYFHRTINPKKLIEVGFSGLGNMTMEKRIARDALPSKTPLSLRLMEPKDVNKVQGLFNEFQKKNTKLTPILKDEDTAKHSLLPVSNVLWTYVIENKEEEITDFISFYRLDSSVLHTTQHEKIEAAYLYYYGTTVSNEDDSEIYKKRLQDLVQSALVKAKEIGFDVFNGLESNQGHLFYKELGFSKGDGSLHYYLFNWQCPSLECKDIGLIMV